MDGKSIKKGSSRKIGCVLICFGLAMIYLVMAGVSNLTYAQRKVKPEWVMPKHYPSSGFDGIGNICRIAVDKGEAVIDDTFFSIASYAEYNTLTGSNISGYLFEPGMKVGYILNKTTKQIESFWLIKME